MKGVPQRRVKASKLQRWWHQRSYELQSGRRTGVYFSLMIQRQWRGYRVRAFIIPKKKKKEKNYFLRSMRHDQAVLVQKIYRGWKARRNYNGMHQSFRHAVMIEWMNEMACKIQKLIRYYLGLQQRKMMTELRQNALYIQLRETSSILIQARIFRGPNARKNFLKLKSIRIIQKYYRGYYIRSQDKKVWYSLGQLERRPKPVFRKTSFFGASKLHLFSHGNNNWELKERMNQIPNYVLHDLGIKKRAKLKVVPNRPIFYNKKVIKHRQKMKMLKQLEVEDQLSAGMYTCTKCLQRGKYPGHVCCCHLRSIICRNCAKNQRSLKVNGRPKTLICLKRKVVVSSGESGSGGRGESGGGGEPQEEMMVEK